MKSTLIALLCLLTGIVTAQNGAMKTVYQNATSSVKDQANTGTCWSFATLSFLESEALRLGQDTLDLSEMYYVRQMYPRKAQTYARTKGAIHFSEGGLSHDVISGFAQYGAVPESVYNGLQYGSPKHNHGELQPLLQSMVKNLSAKDTVISPSGMKAIEAVLDSYLGAVPQTFEYKGKQYTPQTFAKEVVKINAADYVEVTSFTNAPFYTQFVVNIPDNWQKASYYNIPLDDMVDIVVNALKEGQTIAWDADVSESSFRHNAAVADWQETVTQQSRQDAFDKGTTTDDHLMHITGMATDDSGVRYFLTKNSWGASNKMGGYLYVSENYLRMKTIAILVHKKAIPSSIAKKMDIK